MDTEITRGQALIVDDSATARIMLSRLLKKAEFDSHGVASAEDALKELESGKLSDVIFLDHILPGMDGFAALKEIKRNPATANIPVFMYTSQNAERYLEEAKALGAAGVISKQTNREQLYQCLAGIALGQDAANNDLGPIAEDISVAYHKRLEERGVRSMTGRLSTLEMGYEEFHDELRNLRVELKLRESERELILEQRLRRYRWVITALFVFLLVATTVLWAQIDSLDQATQNIRSQFVMIAEIMGHLLEMNSGR